jgi:D-glycero-beta-D-manno-heptose-7-phosphate kinase
LPKIWQFSTIFMQLKQIFEAFNQLKVLIIGDLMVDSYIWGRVDRISPEAPVPVLSVQKRELRLGGAGNVALNIAALGATPILCAVVGADQPAQATMQLLEQNNIPTSAIVADPSRPTTIKERLIASAQQLARIDTETTQLIGHQTYTNILAQIQKHISQGVNVIIFQDYDKGVLSQQLITEVTQLAIAKHIPVVVDPKKRNFLHYKQATLFKPNLKELHEGLGKTFDPNNQAELQQTVATLKAQLQLQGVFLTLSERGVYIDYQNNQHHIPAHIRNIADVSGAGDTVISVAACCLAMGLSASHIASLANLAGGLVCEQVGVVPINKSQLLAEAQKIL